jgi:hypothetical protein
MKSRLGIRHVQEQVSAPQMMDGLKQTELPTMPSKEAQ